MVYLLDTDHLSILQLKTGPAFRSLNARLEMVSSVDVAVSIVSFQEQVRGWLSFIHQARKPAQLLRGYDHLLQLLKEYCKAYVLPFDAAAQREMENLQSSKVRIGTLDLRIAAIATVHGATVLSRNLRDFRQVPGLVVEDWTVP